MAPTLNLLLIEDSEDDAELVGHELRRHGYELAAQRVWSAPALREALRAGTGTSRSATTTCPASPRTRRTRS